MRRFVLLGLLAALVLSACGGLTAGEEGADQASEVSVLVYKSPT